ncbi:hypothetical protein PPYR_04247 [Photinus pyralis]|uniref:Major facilitator superfamily (MFS) profile domain-containing protein n=1 Tax=Photinus pyralis TaxID=7054 RepID=A0A5N4AXI5_PHOPY|nr:hypothetical protein PPYR_04247 [Photinus pyralis]
MTANSVELSRSGGSVVTGTTTEGCDSAANHEVAVKASSFGLFNVLVIAIMLPASLSSVFSTTSMSYVFPIAQCDLNLTVDDKGLLNSVTYFGMLSSGFLSGFLTDTLGRKKLMIYAFIFDGFVVIMCAFSKSFTYLTIVKFFEGFIENGGFAAVIAYTSEFNSAKFRPFIPLFNGIFVNSGAVVLPLMAWIIFTDSINISTFGGFIVLRSWNLFILATAIPSLMAGFLYILLPESPKFLMTVGKNDEALKTFNKMYKCNNGSTKGEYPIKALVDEPKLQGNEKLGHVTSQRSNIQALKEGFRQIAAIFYRPNCINLIMVVIIQFGLLMGNNTLRLWLPQLFAAINDRSEVAKKEGFDLCRTLQTLIPNSTRSNGTCSVNYNNSEVYANNAICGAVAIVILLLSLPMVRLLGKKIVLCGSALGSGLCLIIIAYYGNHITVTLTLSSIHIGFNYVAFNTLLSSIVDLFPTTLRAMAVASAMAFGRFGSSVGNIIFPALLGIGCLYPFLTIGGIILVSAFLAMLLPDSDMKALK